MTVDKKKESRWAKVLDDAGLLDDVEDAWEVPNDRPLRDGATIEVRSSVACGPAVSIIESDAPAKVSRDDETQKVITVISGDARSSDGEDTVRVSYADKHKQKKAADAVANQEGRMPFAPVRRSSLQDGDDSEFIPRTDTQPGNFARHTQSSWDLEDEPQPEYAVGTDDEVGWDTLLEDDRPTIEMPSYSWTASDPAADYSADELLTEDEFQALDAPSVSASTPPAEQKSEAAERAHRSTQSMERFERVRGARISVPGLHDLREQPVANGRITDEPISIAPEPIELSPPSLRIQMAEKYDMNDFSGALAIAEKILSTSADDMDAFQYRKSCRDRLQKIYESRLGDMDHVPRIAVTNHELMWRNLDASAGFILSRIDGVSSYSDILDVSGMPRFETLRILWQLLEEGLVA